MIARTSAITAGSALALLLAGVLTGCATGSGVGLGAGSSGGEEIEVDAAWLDDGRLIGLVTYGSSSCVPMADDVTADGQSISVSLVDPEGQACTRDLVPRVTLVSVPEGIDPSKDVDLAVTYGVDGVGDADLDGVPGLTGGGETDYQPSAGWTGEDDQFVLLTWGSSTCAPVVEDVTASGAAEVTVTFEAPRANQACTMDMAPRGLVVASPDLDEDTDVFAVLTGTPEFVGVRIPILGEN